MPFNLLLFPLVGGYWFVVRFKLVKYYHQRVDSQKLLFNSIIAGTFLLLLSFGFTTLISISAPQAASTLAEWSPMSLPFFWTTAGSFLLGVVISEAGNLFINREKAIKNSIKYIGNELEQLFESAWSGPQLILITLKSEKIYVGWIKSLPIPNKSNYVSILPAFSGYRHKETRRIIFTTQYLDVYTSYVEEGSVTDVRSLAHLVIKIDDIVSANKFDMDMYERFNADYTYEEDSHKKDNNDA